MEVERKMYMAKQCDLLCPFVNRFIKMFTVKKENTVVKNFSSIYHKPLTVRVSSAQLESWIQWLQKLFKVSVIIGNSWRVRTGVNNTVDVKAVRIPNGNKGNKAGWKERHCISPPPPPPYRKDKHPYASISTRPYNTHSKWKLYTCTIHYLFSVCGQF